MDMRSKHNLKHIPATGRIIDYSHMNPERPDLPRTVIMSSRDDHAVVHLGETRRDENGRRKLTVHVAIEEALNPVMHMTLKKHFTLEPEDVKILATVFGDGELREALTEAANVIDMLLQNSVSMEDTDDVAHSLALTAAPAVREMGAKWLDKHGKEGQS